jgi:endonuclease III
MTRVPGRFSAELGLRLERRREREIFLWFLAAVLYGARISGSIVARTHNEFVRRGIVTPEHILQTGWDGLVEILDAGGYTRYDFKTATKLLEVMGNLMRQYGGDLNNLHGAATGARDLEARLKGLGKGVGEVTIQIFLRELRDIWRNAQPRVSALALLAAEHLRLLKRPPQMGPASLRLLALHWGKSGVRQKSFGDFESALVRLGRDYCRRKRWQICPMRELCGGVRG